MPRRSYAGTYGTLIPHPTDAKWGPTAALSCKSLQSGQRLHEQRLGVGDVRYHPGWRRTGRTYSSVTGLLESICGGGFDCRMDAIAQLRPSPVIQTVVKRSI